MKYKFLLIFLFFVSQIFAQWEIHVGSPTTSEYGKDVIETYDNGYLFVSSKESKTIFVTKLDINGNVLWQKTYNNQNKLMRINKVLATSDGGYIMVGYAKFYSSSKSSPLLIKFNSCFELEWCEVIYKPNSEHNAEANDIVEKDDGELILLTVGNCDNPSNKINLYEFSLTGELLWEKDYARKEDYPLLYENSGTDLLFVDGNFFVVGFCYYENLNTPGIAWLRSLIVGIDQDFEEKWLLPFGDQNELVCEVYYGFNFSSDINYAVGTAYETGEEPKSFIMHFNSEGEDLGFFTIPNDSIGLGIEQSNIINIDKLDSCKFLGNGHWGQNNYYSIGELIFDSLGKVYKTNFHQDYKSLHRLVRTNDEKYLQSASYYNSSYNTMDALLYKFNKDLEPDTIYTQAFEYDFHCPDIIESEDIQLDNCIPVGIEELPTPKEYYSYIATIPIRIYPNPASNIVHFELENTEHHKNILLQVYDLQGRPIEQQAIQRGQKEALTNVSNWAGGMYAVVVFSNGKVVGREKFVVR